MSFNNTRTPTKPTGKAKWQLPQRKHPTAGVMEYYLEGELKDKFCQLYPKHSNRRMMKWFGVSFTTLQRLRRELGLQKDMKAIRKELAKDVKRICEKSGYYESLKGKAPSAACMEAIRKKREEGFYPLRRLKETNPRKFRRLVKQRAETMAELRRKDKLRIAYGLEPKTKLVKTHNIGHRASAQKCVMINQCNYFADPDHKDWVCYDSQTQRSVRREATARKHGLKIVQGEEEKEY